MSAPAKSKRPFSPWNLLLALPALGLLFPGIYARTTPEIAGIPFFYWYQVAWILVSAVINAVVYWAVSE